MIKSQTTKSIPIHVDKDLKVQITSNKLEIFLRKSYKFAIEIFGFGGERNNEPPKFWDSKLGRLKTFVLESHRENDHSNVTFTRSYKQRELQAWWGKQPLLFINKKNMGRDMFQHMVSF
jgi:hypothetical protein